MWLRRRRWAEGWWSVRGQSGRWWRWRAWRSACSAPGGRTRSWRRWHTAGFVGPPGPAASPPLTKIIKFKINFYLFSSGFRYRFVFTVNWVGGQRRLSRNIDLGGPVTRPPHFQITVWEGWGPEGGDTVPLLPLGHHSCAHIHILLI